MPGFSTLALGGTIVSPIRLNYDLSISASTTVALAYSNASIVDIVGLQVVIYNSSSSAITLTAGTQFNNYTSYPNYCAVLDEIVIPAFQSITLITTVIGQEYTIESISGKVSVDGGAAGDLIYQTAPNRTGFLAAGTPNYVLISTGPNLPPAWNLLTTGNLAGGVAGSLVYQSAPDTTSKSAVGSAFGNGGGGIASMTTSTTNGWNNIGYQGGLPQGTTYSGGVITWKSPTSRYYTCSTLGGTSATLTTYLTSVGITALDGDVYAIYNNTASQYTLYLNTIKNANSYSPSFANITTPNSNFVYIYPNETVVLQRYDSTNFTIESTTQSQNFTASYTIVNPNTTVAFFPTVGTIINDPNGWSSVGSRTITPKVQGLYLVYIYISQQNASNTLGTISIFKNQTASGGGGSVVAQTISQKLGNAANAPGTYYCAGTSFMNGATDYFAFQSNGTGTANWVGGQIVVQLVN